MEVGILLYINRKNDGFLTKKGEQKMKKIVAILLSVILLFALTGCGKKCYECGKRTNKGYTAFGNFYCEDCFW